MKLVITIVLTLALAVGLGSLSMDDPGYIVLSRDPYVVRLPLLLFVLFLFVAFLLLYLLFNFVAGVFRAPKKVKAWRNKRNENAAQNHTMQGYAGLIEGNWSTAEQSLMKKLEHNKAPLMNYLGAAYAAQQQGNFQRRNSYLDDALSSHPSQYLSVTLTRARLHYQSNELGEARDCLESLRKSSPKSAPGAKLLADVYRDLGDWDSLVKLIPSVRKMKLYPEEEIVRRERMAYENLISSPALLQGDTDRPTTTWNSLPNAKKKDPLVVGDFVKQLIKSGDLKEAETVLRRALNRSYDSELMNLYGKVNSPFVEYQIQLVEKLKKKHGEDPQLTLTLARLYRYQNKLELSSDLYQEAIELGAQDDVLADYGSLLEQMGKTEAALQFYKRGINALSTKQANKGVDPTMEGNLIPLENLPKDVSGEVIPVVR
jgi:HemY protein